MIKFIFILLLLFVQTLSATAQDSAYARSVMMKLGSTEFSGRGYINGGIDSAANFIMSEFERMDIKPLGKSYFQPFTVSVNNITDAFLVLDTDTLMPGLEFILDAHVKDVSGKAEVLTINEKLRVNKKKLNKLTKKIPGKVLILNMYEAKDKESKEWYQAVAYSNPWNAAGIVLLDSSNYNYSVALYGEQQNYFLARIQLNSFPKVPVKSAEYRIKTDYQSKYPVNNVAAYIQGQEFADSFIVVTAHYDHIGMMGNAVFPGGNDNASGVAMMLDLARQIKEQNYRPRYSMIFIAMASEETGLNGSTWFAEHPMMDLKKVKFLLNLDMVGTGSAGITVVNGSKFKTHFQKLVELNDESKYISAVRERGESCNSDHCPFYKKGVPSFFIYTNGREYLEYHTVNDKPENVPMTAYNGVFRLIESFLYSF